MGNRYEDIQVMPYEFKPIQRDITAQIRHCNRNMGTWVGAVCFAILMVPWVLYALAFFSLSLGTKAVDLLIFFVGVFIFACISSLLGFGVARRSTWFIILSSSLLVAVVGGVIYLILRQ
jgi:hypothetical protein